MRVAIVGAGLSGLACAFRLEQQGFQGTVDIYEKKSGVGHANIFLEFISELFHRPIDDLFVHLASEYKLYLLPHQTIYNSQSFGPTKSTIYEGYIGHVVVRGNHENSLEKQLAKNIKTPIKFNQAVDINEIKKQYDMVVAATGRLQDVPQALGARIDRYVEFYHGLIKGSFDDRMTKVWFNNKYASKGYAFQLTLDESTAMVSVASPDEQFNLAKGWSTFIEEVFGSEAELTELHHIKNFAIGRPNRYSFENLLFVGNVGGGVTPAMGFGLHNAILSGIYAADSILKHEDYEAKMRHLDQEYNWSLTLRNALEQMDDQHYDVLVDGIDSILGRVVLKKGGININRLAGRVLSIITHEKNKSKYPKTPKEYQGDILFKQH